jgi:hypothetical protein
VASRKKLTEELSRFIRDGFGNKQPEQWDNAVTTIIELIVVLAEKNILDIDDLNRLIPAPAPLIDRITE